MLSASLNTTSMSFSTSSTLRFPARSIALRICTARSVSSRDSPWVGSSSINSRGLWAMAIATSSSRWSPCDSMSADMSAKRVSRRCSSASSPIAPARRALRACAARRTFSRALSAGKIWQRWKVRAMPFCATRYTGKPVMFSPAKTTSPAFGFSTLVIRLNSVDLPAPFGPMTARISPGSTCMSTASTATSAPNCRVSPLHSSSGMAPSKKSQDSLREEHDEGDEDRAEDERPEIGHLRQLVLEEHEEQRPEHRADQRACAADHHHDEHMARGEPEEELGRGIARETGVERAREPAEAVGEHDRGDLVSAGVVAERDRLRLVLADAGEDSAKVGAHDRAAHQIRAEQAGEHQVVVADPALEPVDAEGPRRARNADHAVRAAGDVAEAEQHRIAELREGQGQHGEGDAGRAGAHPGDRNGDRDRDQHCERDADRQRQPQGRQDPRGAISAPGGGGGVG